jgi:hypothetical protein
MNSVEIRIRKAVAADIPILRGLIEASVRGLQAEDYTVAQMEGALESVFGVDSQLIADGTYLVAEARIVDATPAVEMAAIEKIQNRNGSSLVAGVGVNAKRFMAAITGRGERTPCWTPSATRRRFGRSSFIRRGRGEALGARCLKFVKPRLERPVLRAMKWARR